MTTYPIGSLVTVNFSGEVYGILTTDELAQQLAESIQNAGYSIRSTQVHTSPLWNLVTVQWVHYAYQATIVFTAQWEVSDDELSNVVTNAVLGATGQMPTGIALSGGATVADATPGGVPAPTLTDAVGGFFSQLTTLGIGVLVLVALVVALLVFRPDIGRLAVA